MTSFSTTSSTSATAHHLPSIAEENAIRRSSSIRRSIVASSILASMAESSFFDIDLNDDDMKKKREAEIFDIEQDSDGGHRMASINDTLAFVFYSKMNVFLYICGTIAAVGHGLVYPALAFLLSNILGALATSASSLDSVRLLAFAFMGIGGYSLICATIKTACFEVASTRATKQFQTQWFQALLRQDNSYFDVYDIAAISSTVGANAERYKRGVGPKFSEGIQHLTIAVGGIVYALYASWRITLVVLAVMPFLCVSALMVMKLNQTRTSRANEATAKASGLAYSAITNLRTVLSLNAVPYVISLYKEATLEALEIVASVLWKPALANGSMAASFTMQQAILALYGASLVYNEVAQSGCNPAGTIGIDDNVCESSGATVFGAMIGVSFAARGLSKMGTFFEGILQTRAAVYPALHAMNRDVGDNAKRIYETSEEEEDYSEKSGSKKKKNNKRNQKTKDVTEIDLENSESDKLKAILPSYAIDSFSPGGLKPQSIEGKIHFKNVGFSYPTRPGAHALNGLNLKIKAGQSIGLCGPSGGGKSSLISLIERYYDPNLSGSVELDGVDLREFNVAHLRKMIGYVGQEPVLFATTIAENIRYGNPKATQEQIETAAKMANAHDFISTFELGYKTQVGNKGAQLSGGQKQRIAIARVLVGDPKILILDEATSALDSESEAIVQEALDKAVAGGSRTTIIIAHRLATIRNCDTLAVIVDGKVAEHGPHDELIQIQDGVYRNLVERQSKPASDEGENEEDDSEEMNPEESIVEDDASVATVTPQFAFKDVTFAYPTRKKHKVFDKFNLTINKGETVALVGPSGGGKSTGIALLERYYDPDSGVIEYNGQDLTSYNMTWLRNEIGLVGQEPKLFAGTIAHNIVYGAEPGKYSQQDIEEAAKQASAHDFIMQLESGYDTVLGEDDSVGLSGGQKQRVAIARALIRKPKVLLFDEATSALDTESEAQVQKALDKIMESKDRTSITIAHRLTTIRNVDKIVYVAGGRVQEVGSHDELMTKGPRGKYRRLYETQQRTAKTEAIMAMSMPKSMTTSSKKLSRTDMVDADDAAVGPSKQEEPTDKDDGKSVGVYARARQMAAPDKNYLIVGAVGAILAGCILPAYGVLTALTLQLLYTNVDECVPTEFDDCQAYWDSAANDLQQGSFYLGLYWSIGAVVSLFGVFLLCYGFGMAAERTNKRVRDQTFEALIRQPVKFFDEQNIGSLLSQIQEDVVKISAFSADMLQTVLVAVISVTAGVIIAFIMMWPFALLNLACGPAIAAISTMNMRVLLGEDEKNSDNPDDVASPGGILVETLLNMRTVAALNLEKQRLADYENALYSDPKREVRSGFVKGLSAGFAELAEQWLRALQFWFGGWLINQYPELFTFEDYLISNFAILSSFLGLGSVFSSFSSKQETEEAAKRIFAILDRESDIDPLSDEGTKQ